ncbi:MAG: hypothetical protein AAGD38_05075 [Acidobacteriota bacterium]
MKPASSHLLLTLLAVLLLALPASARLDDGQPLVELAGQRVSEAGAERFDLRIALVGPAHRFDGLAIVSLPSETVLLAIIEPGVVEARIWLGELDALNVDRGGLASLDRDLTVSLKDPAVLADDAIAVRGFHAGSQVELTRAKVDGPRFGMAASFANDVATRALPNVACFSWNCQDSTMGGNTGECDFDASCSVTNQGYIWKRYWQWDDGSTSLLPGSTATTTHFFPTPVSQRYFNVTLSDWYFGSSSSPSITCCVRAFTQVIGPVDGLDIGLCSGSSTYVCP